MGGTRLRSRHGLWKPGASLPPPRRHDQLAAEREAVKQQRQFVAMVSHEFRTPLAVIDATAQSTDIACSRSGCTLYDQGIAGRHDKIRRAVRRVVNLLDNYLTGERIEFHDAELRREPMDLCDLARAKVASWQALLQSHDQLRLVLGDAPLPVAADGALLGMALSNLIDNAVKYSPSGSPVAVSASAADGCAWIEVADSGCGIPAAEAGKVFEKFYRSGDAQDVPGAGLGLYLVRSIAHRHGGSVELESTPGQGSRFRLRLPLALQEA